MDYDFLKIEERVAWMCKYLRIFALENYESKKWWRVRQVFVSADNEFWKLSGNYIDREDSIHRKLVVFSC